MFTFFNNVNHEESVYGLIPTITSDPPAPKMYRSIHADRVRLEAEMAKRHCCKPKPQVECEKRKCEVLKGATPKAKCGVLQTIPTGCRDFIRANAVKAIRSSPRVPAPRYIDDPKGTSHDWINSGLPRRYVYKEDFGRIPAYLEKRNEELYEMDQEEKRKLEQAGKDADAACRHMTEEERSKLLCGLKKRWNEVFRDFQSLPLSIDTPGKIRQKSLLENELKSIEKDIQLIVRHNHIFVADTPATFYLS